MRHSYATSATLWRIAIFPQIASSCPWLRLHLATSHILFCHHLLRQPLGRWPSVLKTPIASRQAQHVSGAARLAGRLFAERRKAFRRRLKWLVASAPPAANLATDQFSGCARTDADPRFFHP